PAVHRTVLRSDEGLVGLVASEANPINLSDAQNHPAFSYRRDTGEEIYHAFRGVPILRAGNTLGVLVVQNRARRTYSEEEEEALATTAMVLAEMIASGELSSIARPGAPEPAARRPRQVTGVALNDGIALGHVVLHEPRVVITNFIADDVPKELKRLEAAVETLRSDLDELSNRLMHQLMGKDYAPPRDRLPENAVLVARSMGPAALLDYDRKRLRGLVLEEGGPTSHVAIVARALGIAAVGEIPNATGDLEPGDAIIVDGSSGIVHMRPTPDMEAAYVERVRIRARRQLQY